MKSAITISLVPEARGGPFVFWDDLAAACAQAAELGFDAVEIFPSAAETLDPSAVKRLIAMHGLGIAALGSGAGWLKHKLRLTDPDASIRKRAREFAGRVIDVAGDLGAPAIIGSMQGRWGDGLAREQATGWLSEALEELAERAARHQTPLLYEPLNRYETNLFNRQGEAAALLRSLRMPNVKLLCDLFHMNIEESSIADALRAAGSLVGHVHFVDSNRLAVGFGHIDMGPIMAALREIGYAGYLSGEVLPLPDSVAAAKQTMKAFKALTR
ncbi:MAG: sugar phosphate isomerase [Verrucomicrobia bacterium]|nr:MAG: sugar phosphate isomerase [Verrucomicrobiota bacterium]